ncbi:hypothetical protein JYT72_02140 [Crocinitomix catalasitica]|nr:hypothetical protein [Crocinitomix catalasitica]
MYVGLTPMNSMKIIVSLIIILLTTNSFGQEKSFRLSFNIKVSDSIKSNFKTDGRLFLFISSNPQAPPLWSMFPGSGCNTIAKNISDFPLDDGLQIKKSKGWTATENWTFENVPEGTYYIQATWDQDLWQSGVYNEGTSYSEQTSTVIVDKNKSVSIELDEIIQGGPIVHKLVREINFLSDTLSSFWNKPMSIKAAILLPSGYGENDGIKYPIRYNIAGYGGRYTRVRGLLRNEKFMTWWESDDSPQIINVFLDGFGPFGDCYQMDSDNSGPYGYSLIKEQIPYIESLYRGTNSVEGRFVDGCSTGGWVSLGLQLYYPDDFSGCFSYSPDPVDFENFQLINVYSDNNAFINEHGYEIPMRRSVNGQPIWSMREYIKYENIQSPTNSYTQSGGQFSAFVALYSPKGDDGLPMPIFDPESGIIDTLVGAAWEKYDYLKYVEKNWDVLGPKIEGKIFISVSDMDNFYLSYPMKKFDDYLKTRTNPTSNAEIEFLPYTGHCRQYSHKIVLEKIEEKLKSAD